tara:strand:- start:354 stop:551 length:198 start_codon:yes stop_codon:yes gene_type:complete
VKNSIQTSNKNKFSKYFSEDIQTHSTDINILLNRVRLNEKKKSNKKIVFSALVLTFSLCFGALIF